jgi:hypothetical protein
MPEIFDELPAYAAHTHNTNIGLLSRNTKKLHFLKSMLDKNEML